MHDEETAHGVALAELRTALADGLARRGLTVTQLAAQARLGRTTVHEALQPDADIPSARTVAALARVLRLPEQELLDLRRTAAGEAAPTTQSERRPGRPISECNPYDLEVHSAGLITRREEPRRTPEPVLPGYVPRAHDDVLTDAVRDAADGHSRMVVLVGSSSTGKTRACWEAVQPLAEQGWRLWHPFDPTRAEAALGDLERVGPHTVVWFNEAQHYVGDLRHGETIAAALRTLLTAPARGPVLVLGTLWPDYERAYSALPQPGQPDEHAQVRELLAGRTVPVPESFDQAALEAARVLAEGGDAVLAAALPRAADGRLTQDLAGAPELLRRYRTATPPARALLHAAMDARRLGAGLHLSLAFLTDAATDYLTDHEYDALTPDWAERALAELAQPVHGRLAPLRRTQPRRTRRAPGSPTAPTDAPAPGVVYRLADYLEQHGRDQRRPLCPPASFWHAAHDHLTGPDDLERLAAAARDRLRLRWAHHLYQRAGTPFARTQLALIRDEIGDREGAEQLAAQAAETGDGYSLIELAFMRERAGDLEGSDRLLTQVADTGEPGTATTVALTVLGRRREKAGDLDGAEQLLARAARTGHPGAFTSLARIRERAGDFQGAEQLLTRAAQSGHPSLTLTALARIRERAGDLEGVEQLLVQAVQTGHASALTTVAEIREKAGDLDGAEQLLAQAAQSGDAYAFVQLARIREQAGDAEGAEQLLARAVRSGDPHALMAVAEIRERAGDLEKAEHLITQAADTGHPGAVIQLAGIREKAGDLESAVRFLSQASEAGHPFAFDQLIDMLERSGDLAAAERLLAHAADSARLRPVSPQPAVYRLWPYGLEPDGTPTPPW
ncbi:hypothetical protein [Streptomyces sp. NBC_00272]|uniref:hypothetical protein n=1 Tax=Streptomyces sp. NBC_00272 TaxID=2975698 RepID=UPI002E289279|nr:hypothetical protein [Streptomyces sp. NBC_00272]